MCSLAEKAALLESNEPAFSTTSHYDGHGAILVDLDLVDPGQLLELLTDTWRLKAPRRLRTRLDADLDPPPDAAPRQPRR